MARAHGGTEGGDRVVDALLGQGDDVHVSLHHDEPLDALSRYAAGFVQSVQLARLVEDRRPRVSSGTSVPRRHRRSAIPARRSRPPAPRVSRMGNTMRSRSLS